MSFHWKVVVCILTFYSRFKHLMCNRKAARAITTVVVNLISHRQLYIATQEWFSR